MTSSRGGSPGIPWMPAGWCRTSRRCSMTTRCSRGWTRTCGGAPGWNWAGGWRGLAAARRAGTGLLLGGPAFTDGARRAAELLARVHFSAGRLARTSRDGVASSSAGVLEDYACVAEGLLTLSGVTGEARWLSVAGELLGTALARFGDGRGGLYDTPDHGEAPGYRPRRPA